MKKEKKKKEEKETIKKITHNINIHSKYPKFLIYILHNRQGQLAIYI